VAGPRPHLAAIGRRSRPAGSAAAAAARGYCAEILRTAGFVVQERSFEYSRFAGAYATSIAGVVASLCAIGLYVGRRAPTIGVAAAVVLVATVAALGWVGRAGVLEFPALRRSGVNLEAVRGVEEPLVWLVAHIDSKWQPVSIVTSAGLMALAVLALVRPADREGVAASMLMLTWLGSVPLMLSIVGDRNTGTLDNASGVAAVLEAAEELRVGPRVGVLITDAEELGLAGSRAWVRGRSPAIALNCDSVDDRGDLTVMCSRGAPAELVYGFQRAAAEQSERLRLIGLIPGMLTDHVPLAEAGWRTVTLSRGNLRTLSRIHTRRDTLVAMDGTGIASAARILARIATELG
jgi:hypothetical protein